MHDSLSTRRAHLDYLEGGPCYVIAEAGSNHNGDPELANRLIDVAADTGADAVKFQLFRADRLYPPGAGAADYLESGEDIFELIRRMELPESWLPVLAGRAAERGIDFLVTPFDEASADLVADLVPAFKLSSYELSHHPLVRHVAAKGKPLIMSTGASTLEDVDAAIAVARATGNDRIVLLQCTAAYPANLEALNISALSELRERYGVPVGLSDHSRDPVIAPIAAVALGAAVLEKHFTLDRSLPGPDHAYAIEPDELARLVRAVRDTERALGSGHKEVHSDENELREFARRTIFAVTDIPAGTRFDKTNLAILRAGKRGRGLEPSALAELLGRRAARPVPAGTPLVQADVD